MISQSSTTIFKCNSSFQIDYIWSVNKIDANTITSIDLSSNPTSKSSQILFQSNSLDYGLYEINLRVKITPITYAVIDKNVSTFIQIIPTRIGVYPLLNGIQTLRIGLGQTLILDPRKYSPFYDRILVRNPIQDLNFTFSCNSNILTISKPSSCFKTNGNTVILIINIYIK
jgi:hypothetical protein